MSETDSRRAASLLRDEELTALVAAELGSYGRLRPGDAPAHWGFSLPRRKGAASIHDGWLTLDFTARGRPSAPPRLLDRNLTLAGNAKYCLFDDGAARIRADIPLDGVPMQGLTGVGQHIRDGVLGIASALGIAIPNLPAEVGEAGDAPAPSIPELCSGSGWAFDDIGDGRIRVELESTADGFYQAVVAPESGRLVQRATPFTGAAVPEAESSRLGLAALLLSVSGRVRMARAVSWPSAGAPVPGFEVSLPLTTSAAAFGHGLGALSVACDACAREALALAEDVSLAEAYLAIRHPGLVPRTKRSARSSSSHSKSATSS